MANTTSFQMAEAVALLERTPAALNALLRGLPESWVRHNEGENTWSPFDIVGHLVVGERSDWIPRLQRILEHGEAKPFDPFDRFAQFKENGTKSLEEVLDEFSTLRAQSLAELSRLNLQSPDFERKGRHLRLGSVTLGQLLATWATHDLNHLHQLARVMAYQYRDAVGPWSRFLGVLHCNGHGE